MSVERKKVVKYQELLDELDFRIINSLIKDGRASFRSLAREFNVGETTIYTRIKKLRDLGIIKGFHAEVDLTKLGYRTQAYVFLKVPVRKIKEVSMKLKKLENVYEIYEITGDYQFLLKFIGRNNEELAKFMDELGNVGEIIETKTIYVIKPIKIPEEFKVSS